MERAGVSRTLNLRAGANFVAYTGSGGDVVALLGEISGLQAAFLYDAAQQRWTAFRPAAPAFLNEATALSRLDALFIMVEGPTAWTFAQATATGTTAIPAAALQAARP